MKEDFHWTMTTPKEKNPLRHGQGTILFQDPCKDTPIDRRKND